MSSLEVTVVNKIVFGSEPSQVQSLIYSVNTIYSKMHLSDL